MYFRFWMITFFLLITVWSQGNTQTCQGPGLRISPSNCTCLGGFLVYECTVLGSGTTIWDGSAFHCPGDRVILRHSQFNSGTSDSCNNGEIVGRSAGVVDNVCFTSLLNVTVGSNMNGETVSCTHNVDANTTVVGVHTITITTERNPYPPPNNVQVVDINQYALTGQLTFNWSSVTAFCPSAYYVLTSINCGVCPSSTTNNQVTCENAALGHTCSFVVRTVVCGNITGNPSNSVSAVLKVPRIQSVDSVPMYDDGTSQLRSVLTTFEEAESFIISDGIDGSATSYTITYTDAVSSDMCSEVTVPATVCVKGICSHLFEVSSSNCRPFADISVTVFGTNVLGNGTVARSVTIGYINKFVQIMFSLPDTFCMFLNEKTQGTSSRMCSIVYGPANNGTDGNCANGSQGTEGILSTTGNFVGINLLALFQHRSEDNQLCFVATAKDGVHTAKVTGTFNAGCDPQQLVSEDTISVANTLECGEPLRSLGISNGVVCLTGIHVGATAIYSCSNYDTATKIISVRTCLPNGIWNGTIPQCEGSTVTWPLGITASLTVVTVGLVISFVLIFTFIVVIIILTRAKAKVQNNLKQATSNAVYDEIETFPAVIDSNKNVAYSFTVPPRSH